MVQCMSQKVSREQKRVEYVFNLYDLQRLLELETIDSFQTV